MEHATEYEDPASRILEGIKTEQRNTFLAMIPSTILDSIEENAPYYSLHALDIAINICQEKLVDNDLNDQTKSQYAEVGRKLMEIKAATFPNAK